MNQGSANPQSQGASAATQNGDLAPGNGPLEKSTLSLALARMAEPGEDETQSASASSQEPPVSDDAPAPEADANLTEGETPAAEGDEPPAGQGENVLSQSDQETQAQLAALAEAIKGPDGKVNIGEVKRIKDLLKEKSGLTQQLQVLEAKVAELEQGKPAETPLNPAEVNPLANLKTEQDLRKAKRQMHEVLEFAEENPNGGSFRGQEFDETQVRELRRDARRALDLWLPERAEQLQRETVFQQQQTQHRQVFLREYPQFADPENPDAKVAATLAKSPYIRQQPNPDYIAAALAIGDRVLREQAAAKAKPAAKPAAGGVPRAKPATATTAGSNSAPRSQVNLGAAIDQVKKERSRDALANLFAKTTG